KCLYCAHETTIPHSAEDVQELDYHAHLGELAASEATIEIVTVKCASCGAETTLPPGIVSDECAFCGTPVVAEGKSIRVLRPKGVLPFAVGKNQALAKFRDWLTSRWFVPNALTRQARTESSRMQGVYVPYWTYDADATSWYEGERGTYFTWTITKNGRTVTIQNKSDLHWRSVSGVVYDNFDDVLVLASSSLSQELADGLAPWDLENLQPLDEQYLAGYKAEAYHVSLDEGFEQAKTIMEAAVHRSVADEIGGDRRRIDRVVVQHNNVTFKHVLLPMWINSYRFQGKVYAFLVNARTGEVQGERPWSWVKITIFVLMIVCFFLVIPISFLFLVLRGFACAWLRK
ncbi:MAG: hypothetical protein N2C14_32210, partial [Planctomycetales bacterium]